MKLKIVILTFAVFLEAVTAKIDPQNLRCLGVFLFCFTNSCFISYNIYKKKLNKNYSVPYHVSRIKSCYQKR